MEPKMHPRDWPARARVRVSLTDDKGSFVVPGIESKEALLRAVAKILPDSQFRRQRLIQVARQMEMERQQRAAAAAAAPKSAKSIKDASKPAGGATPPPAAASASDKKVTKKKK